MARIIIRQTHTAALCEIELSWPFWLTRC